MPLLLALIAFPLPAGADENCRPLDELRPAYQQITSNCQPSPNCQNTLISQSQLAQKIINLAQQSCQPRGSQKSITVNGQEDAQAQELAVVRAAEEQTAKLINLMDESFNKHREKMRKVASTLRGGPYVALAKTLESQDSAKSANVERGPRDRIASEEPDLFAARNGADFLHRVAMERERKKAVLADLQKKEQEIVANRDNSKSLTGGSGKGMSASDMIPLASTMAGMAGMLKKSPGADSSNVTDPNNQGGLGATAPTPSSENNSQSNRPGSLNFGSPLAKQPGNAKPTPDPLNPASPLPAPGSTGLGADMPAGSDVSSKQSTPTPAAATGHLSASGMGTGSASALPAGAEAARESAAANEEEAAGGGPTGSGFGGFGPVSAPKASTDAGSDADGGVDATKDIYDAARDAAAESPGEAAGPEVGDANGENLFLRVRACLTRNLRKGKVLNGLGERVEE